MSELFKWDRGAKLFLHNLLGADHGDTLAASVTAGALIIGNATPKWSLLSAGTRGQALRMGSSLPAWSTEDGWIDMGAQTWTYASSSTFTVPGDQTAIYKKGLRLKFTQTTVKYAVVVSSSYSSPNTTVTILVNTSYTIANAAISANYITFANPVDWPGWFSYTPTITSSSGTITSTSITSARYCVLWNTIHIEINMKITNAGTGAGALQFTVPFTIAYAAGGAGRENALTGKMVQIYAAASSTGFSIFNYDNTTMIATNAIVFGTLTVEW